MMNQQKFSLAVSGDGSMLDPFVAAVKSKYRNVKIYDRNEEARRPPSTAPIPSHPEVADIDAIFIKSGTREAATIRCYAQHQFFNYESDLVLAGGTMLEILLKQMVQALENLLWPPEPVFKDPEIEEESEERPEAEPEEERSLNDE